MSRIQKATPDRIKKGLEAVISGEEIPRYLVQQISRRQYDYPLLFESYQYAKAAREIGELSSTVNSQHIYNGLLKACEDSFKEWERVIGCSA